ncbi:MAG: methyltransferase family protein [Chloroflexota bacterium]
MALVSFMILFIIWAVAHSITAAAPFKRWVRRKVGGRAYDGFYRLFYNVVAVVTFVPVLYVAATSVPHQVLWRVRGAWRWIFLFIQVVAFVALVFSLWQTDPLHFAGVRQAYRFLRGDEEVDPPRPFIRRGVYALVRHPLYLFSMLFIWFAPVVTLGTFLFNLIATVYFLLGAVHEERRLLREFGDTYRRYRDEVPSFIPFL